MYSFSKYLKEDIGSYEELQEKLITFNKKAYPRFGNVVIMAGGAGSGKGAIKENLLGIEGYNFDVDELKMMATKSKTINKRVKEETGIDLAKMVSTKGGRKPLKDPNVVFQLHSIVADVLNLDDRKLGALYTSILTADPERKPNIIFDVTMKNMKKLDTITRQVSALGYDKQNIHIVWVIQDVNVAMKLNQKRDRTVPADILFDTHRGAAMTMKDILHMGKSLKKYMDGDIAFAFNKVDLDKKEFDTELVQKDSKASEALKNKFKMYTGKGKSIYVKDSDYFYVKRAGSPPKPIDKLDKEVRMKIQNYVPKEAVWG